MLLTLKGVLFYNLSTINEYICSGVIYIVFRFEAVWKLTREGPYSIRVLFQFKSSNPTTIHKKIIDIWLNKICERETSASACPLTKEQVVAVGWVVRGASKQLMSRRVVTSKSWLGWNSRLKTQTAHNAEFMMIDVNKNKKLCRINGANSICLDDFLLNI